MKDLKKVRKKRHIWKDFGEILCCGVSYLENEKNRRKRDMANNYNL